MKMSVVFLVASLSLVACHKKPAADPAASTTTSAEVSTPVAPSAPLAAPAPGSAPAAPAVPAPFDKASVPVSTVKLGAFPYLSLPAGYVADPGNTLDVVRFPFWLGDHFEWVEGKAYLGRIVPGEKKEFSKYELQRNIEALVEQAGGKKLAEAKIPGDALDKLGNDAKQGLSTGLGDIYNDAAAVYLIHQADRDIWIHFTANTAQGNWAIVEAKPFVPTAKLLPASALKDAIDTTGKATIAVNFALDQAVILPDSRPQIGEVVALLRDPGLKLSVEGHTDASGTPAHNLALSQARAGAVVAALTGAGVARDRLRAKGFGADRPVADNATDAGRARNRRVELVRV